MSNLRKDCVTLIILGDKGHTFACFCDTGRDHQKPAPGHVRWNSNLQWLSINSFFFFLYLFVIDHNHFRVSPDFPVIIIIYLQSNQVIVI